MIHMTDYVMEYYAISTLKRFDRSLNPKMHNYTIAMMQSIRSNFCDLNWDECLGSLPLFLEKKDHYFSLCHTLVNEKKTHIRKVLLKELKGYINNVIGEVYSEIRKEDIESYNILGDDDKKQIISGEQIYNDWNNKKYPFHKSYTALIYILGGDPDKSKDGGYVEALLQSRNKGKEYLKNKKS